MPKLVDHESRRAGLARAVWAVIARHGIEGATVRKVAEEAGVSMGGLRHYFDNQQGLLRFAAMAVGANISASVARILASDERPDQQAQQILETVLPLDEDRRVEAEVWMACLVRSRVDETLHELQDTGWTGTRHICRLAVALCRDTDQPGTPGDPLADPELEQWAQHLHTFIDGLTLQAVTYPDHLPAKDLRAAVHWQLARITAN